MLRVFARTGIGVSLARDAGVVDRLWHDNRRHAKSRPLLPMAAQIVRYIILTTRTEDGYQAFAPTFPNLIGRGRGARSANSHLKSLIKTDLRHRLANFAGIPKDVVVQTKTLRVDVSTLDAEVSLG